MELKTSREEAEAAGDILYRGNPCKRGHDGVRYVVGHACKPCVAIRVRTFREETDKVRNGHLRRKYGFVPGQFEKMLADQGGRCALCKGPSSTTGTLHVDHCHDTGKVRALLCHQCNVGLGHFKDSPSLLHEAISYLHKHKVEMNGKTENEE